MELYNKAYLTKKLFDSPFKLFTFNDLRVLFGINNQSSLKKIISRLVVNKILERLEINRYMVIGKEVDNFAISNFVYQPSYISLESALSLYGILSQIPYETTAITIKKSKTKNIHHNVYSYSHIQNKLFWGYEKMNGVLIAKPEKALLDQAYLFCKGLRQFPIDEYDLERLDIKILSKYLLRYPNFSIIKQLLVPYITKI